MGVVAATVPEYRPEKGLVEFLHSAPLTEGACRMVGGAVAGFAAYTGLIAARTGLRILRV